MSRRTEALRRFLPSIAAAVLVGGLWSAALAAPVAAHSIVIASEPADGALVEEPPREVRLVFTERVSVSLTSIDLVAGDGRRLAVGAVRHDPGDPNALLVSLPDLSRDTYRLAWRSVSEQDLHATEGSIVFGVGIAPGFHGANASAEAHPIDRLVRGVQIIGLALFVGTALVSVLLGRAASAASAGGPRRRVAILATVSAAALIAANAAAIVVTASATGPLDRTLLLVLATPLGSRLGGSILLGSLGLALAVLLAWHQGPGRRRDRALLALVVALTVLQASSGHLASQPGLPPGVGVIVATLHLLAAAVWSGGVVVLAIAVVPDLRRGPVARSVAVATARSFGAVAAVAFAFIVVTGLVAAGQLIGSIDALLLSDYGHLVWVKSALLLVAGALGLASASRLHPRVRLALARFHVPIVRRRRWMARSDGRPVALEALAMIGVLAAATNLASTQPARGPLWEASTVAPDHASGQADDLVLSLDVRPNRPGRNFVAVGVFDSRRPAPAPIGQVRVVFDPVDGGDAIERPAAAVAPGRYEVVIDALNRPADWLARVEVDRPGMAQAKLEVPWTVPAAGVPVPGERPVIVSDRPLEPIADAAAGVTIMIAIAAVAAVAVLRRPARTASRADVRPLAPSGIVGR